MQFSTLPQCAGYRGRQVCAALVGIGLLAGVSGCGSEAESTPTAVTQAPPASSPSETLAAETGAPTEVDGVYRITWTVEELTEEFEAIGDPDPAGIASDNAGTLELTLDAGRYNLHWVDYGGNGCPGTYAIDGDRIVLTATTRASEWECGDGLGEVLVDAAWAVDENELALTDWNLPSEPAMSWFGKGVLGSKPLDRVDDTE